MAHAFLVKVSECDNYDRLDGYWERMNDINANHQAQSAGDDDIPLGYGESVGVGILERLIANEVLVQDDG